MIEQHIVISGHFPWTHPSILGTPFERASAKMGKGIKQNAHLTIYVIGENVRWGESQKV
jgi:hypothetical protein